MPAERETILVVDDEMVVLRVAELMLIRYGYSVITAQSGAEATELVQNWCSQEERFHIHLGIIDLSMPEMDGRVLAERLTELLPGLPVIYLASYSEQARLSRDGTSGTPVLTKPFSSQALTREIRALLDKKNHRAWGSAGGGSA